MSPPLDIRRGGPTDLPAVLEVLRDSELPTADLIGVSDLHLWVLETMHGLAGVIALERFGSEALLRSLAVAPQYRKRGIGHQLVARLEKDARAAGVRRLFLLTETAERFFLSLGYTVLDRSFASEPVRHSAEFRSLCPASAVCMSKALMDQMDRRGTLG